MEWFVTAGLLGAVVAAKTRRESRQITFEITTRTPLPVGEQVFITGNHELLGDWSPDGMPLTRVDDNVWSGTAVIPADSTVEYKITRGSWQTEEVLEDGNTPPNAVIKPDGNRLISHQVARWKDTGISPIPQITGNYRVHEGVHSKYLRFDRRVIVWLPPSYQEATTRHYPVIYIQDGQQVFDPQTSTWKQDWQVDEWCSKLIVENSIQEAIVVAIYSTEDRFVEYNPSLAGTEYARFMLTELKPLIEREYRTLPGRETTFVAGASMGATIAFYLAWTHPDVYSAAACLSPAFKFRDDEFSFEMVEKQSRAPDIRIYLYCGRGDSTEQELAAGTQRMTALLEERGLARGRNVVTVEDPDGKHNEASWAKHTGEWLRFLLPR